MIRLDINKDTRIEDMKLLDSIEENNKKIQTVSLEKLDVNHNSNTLGNNNEKRNSKFDSILQEEIKKYL